MASDAQYSQPALHNAMWPGLVGKGGPGAEPPIDLETMLDLTTTKPLNIGLVGYGFMGRTHSKATILT